VQGNKGGVIKSMNKGPFEDGNINFTYDTNMGISDNEFGEMGLIEVGGLQKV